MPQGTSCPVCRNVNGGTCRRGATSGRLTPFDCDVCGEFVATGTVLAGLESDEANLSPFQRVLLSHRIRGEAREGVRPRIESDWLDRFKTGSRLPSPAQQAVNLIRVIGDCVLENFTSYAIMESTIAIVGAYNENGLYRVLNQLVKKGLVQQVGKKDILGKSRAKKSYKTFDLTLDGWERYETERLGQFAGKYGFIAMKFGDKALDPFVKNVVKPTVKKSLGYDLVDMRDVPRAGIIDNIIRTQIRDAAFVLVDLTHDNSGAYWEAGYAEGLGKPVIYICEKEKFVRDETHFDTNHCTTVVWSLDDTESFGRQLIATLRSSMNLFPE